MTERHNEDLLELKRQASSPFYEVINLIRTGFGSSQEKVHPQPKLFVISLYLAPNTSLTDFRHILGVIDNVVLFDDIIAHLLFTICLITWINKD